MVCSLPDKQTPRQDSNADNVRVHTEHYYGACDDSLAIGIHMALTIPSQCTNSVVCCRLLSHVLKSDQLPRVKNS